MNATPTMTGTVTSHGNYRYELGRSWGLVSSPGPLFIMLNPSTADASNDDPTIRKCVGFAQRWGFTQLTVVNLFAWRATKPADLWKAVEPVGPRNNSEILWHAYRAPLLVAAWGANVHPTNFRVIELRELFSGLNARPFSCLGYCANQSPRHPLMVAYKTPLRPFRWRT